MYLQKDRKIKQTLKNHCPKNVDAKRYKNYNHFTKKRNRQDSIVYSAKQNVPLLPKKKHKQPVLGTTQYLLPYFCLPDFFNVFVLHPNDWTIEKNNRLIHTLIYLNEPIIRVVTKPNNLLNKDNSLRVTATELCILFNNGYEIYQLIDKDYDTIYFLVKKGFRLKLHHQQKLALIHTPSTILYL
jgi:hypothetical protein